MASIRDRSHGFTVECSDGTVAHFNKTSAAYEFIQAHCKTRKVHCDITRLKGLQALAPHPYFYKGTRGWETTPLGCACLGETPPAKGDSFKEAWRKIRKDVPHRPTRAHKGEKGRKKEKDKQWHKEDW